MSEPTRSFPDRPSLRYLRLEAKRRVSAGEFPALHEAQLAIAREHGLSSWTALKQFLESQPRPAGHAVEQLSWVISRFAGADRPAWVAPADEEMRQHFDDRFLSKIPPGNLVTTLARKAESFREELVVTFDGPLQARAQLSGSLQVHTSSRPSRRTGSLACGSTASARKSPTRAPRRRPPAPPATFPPRWPGWRTRRFPNSAWSA
jgi:hypothetical protein